MQVGDANQNAPVGTTMALLERGSKVMSQVFTKDVIILRKKNSNYCLMFLLIIYLKHILIL
jgi:hypothetical protein